jgi:iron complex outermembrane receptor protein
MTTQTMRTLTHSKLMLSLLIALSHTSLRAASDQDKENATPSKKLAPVTVTASPLQNPGTELLQPAAVLNGTDLNEQRANTLGETVDQIPGVQSSHFGPGVGRPIIRGLEGARVQVLSGGLSSMDVSTVSADHALSIEPFLADQIEVLKGPSTLLYGSGAIGGVVNVVDGRIAENNVDALEGRAEIQHNSVNNENAGLMRIDLGGDHFNFHFDYARRSGDDYDLPENGTLDNSSNQSLSKAVGLSYTDDWGYLGTVISTFDKQYGIPTGASFSSKAQNTIAQINEEEIETVKLDLNQQKVEVKTGINQPWDGFEKLNIKLAHNDYQHQEIEVDTGEVGTEFNNNAYDGRVELVHAPLGVWQGALGLQFGRRSFSAVGEEAFIPAAVSKDHGLFWIEQARFSSLHIELGARWDQQSIDSEEAMSYIDHNTLSLSAAARFDLNDQWHLSTNLDRAERAPVIEELLSNGPHAATSSFEIGNSTLNEETSKQIELGVHYHNDKVQAKLSTYYNHFDDFIYLQNTGREEDGLPVRQWQQADAKFHGFEGEIEAQLLDTSWGQIKGKLFADWVKGNLVDGGNLPRIVPSRVGAGLVWEYEAWRASVNALNHARQNKVADNELPTDGFTLLDAHLSYAFGNDQNWELFLSGTNLTNRIAYVHSSLIKEQSPLPGRGIAFGLRSYF